MLDSNKIFLKMSFLKQVFLSLKNLIKMKIINFEKLFTLIFM